MTSVRHMPARPPVPPCWTPPRMTRAELHAAVIGRPGTPPDALDIIDAIVATQTSIALIEARRRPDGTLTVNDQAGLEVRSAPLSRWFQILGLYPVESPA